MPGRVHQSLLWLLRRDPGLAVELAYRVLGRSPPSSFVAVDRNAVLQRPDLRDHDGTVELDLLLTLHQRFADGRIGAAIRQIWIVEVQTVRDLGRAQAWFEYFDDLSLIESWTRRLPHAASITEVLREP